MKDEGGRMKPGRPEVGLYLDFSRLISIMVVAPSLATRAPCGKGATNRRSRRKRREILCSLRFLLFLPPLRDRRSEVGNQRSGVGHHFSNELNGEKWT